MIFAQRTAVIGEANREKEKLWAFEADFTPRDMSPGAR